MPGALSIICCHAIQFAKATSSMALMKSASLRSLCLQFVLYDSPVKRAGSRNNENSSLPLSTAFYCFLPLTTAYYDEGGFLCVPLKRWQYVA